MASRSLGLPVDLPEVDVLAGYLSNKGRVLLAKFGRPIVYQTLGETSGQFTR